MSQPFPAQQDDDVLSLIDFLAIEFPHARLSAPGFEQLLTLADQGVIGILDLEFGTVLTDLCCRCSIVA
jgi:hypothetical protein